jgi:hypothetical protein
VFSGIEGCAIAISAANCDIAIWFTNDFRQSVDDFDADGIKPGKPLRPCPRARLTLRLGASFQDRHLAQTQATFRHQNDSRRPVQSWLRGEQVQLERMLLKSLADLMIRDRTTFDQLERETKRCPELTHSWQTISSNYGA